MINRFIWIGLGVLVFAYLMYKVMVPKNAYEEDVEKEFNEVISSDKYKVKGQYD